MKPSVHFPGDGPDIALRDHPPRAERSRADSAQRASPIAEPGNTKRLRQACKCSQTVMTRYTRSLAQHLIRPGHRGMWAWTCVPARTPGGHTGEANQFTVRFWKSTSPIAAELCAVAKMPTSCVAAAVGTVIESISVQVTSSVE